MKIIYNEREVDSFKTRPGLGDLVEATIKPIAKALKLPCLDEQGNLKPESNCNKRKEKLNKIKL